MNEKSDLPDKIKYINNKDGEFLRAQFDNITKARIAREPQSVELHHSDDRRMKEVRLDPDNPHSTLEKINEQAIEPEPSLQDIIDGA